ncbi:MAG: DUF2461 domain-containing protein [Tannerellaceae bacterium]|nr:DUF2461 domain-containing protein [Tannerellaceae bacterium]
MERNKRGTGREALAFLKDLRDHNHREWFQENKGRYEPLRKWFTEAVEDLLGRLAVVDDRLRGMGARSCIYRINRDIRFSPDKTLYKTHFGAYMAYGGRKSPFAGYYLHIEPGNCMVSGGLWMPEPKLLKAVRKDIYERGEEFASIVEDPSFKQFFPCIEGEQLKVMPQGYPKDCPYGEYLRYKSFCVDHSLPDSFFTKANWIDESLSLFSRLLPFTSFLNETVDDLYFSESQA